jgi:chromosome segregation ATPase
MDNFGQLESNLFESFNRVKSDILNLSQEMNKVSQAIAKLSADQDGFSGKSSAFTRKLAELQTALAKLISQYNLKIAEYEKTKQYVIDLSKRTAFLEKALVKQLKTNERLVSLVRGTTVRSVKVVAEKKANGKHKKYIYVASKSGKKFHVKNCVFAQNIKPKSMVKFHSKDAMLNKGYKPCKCIK